VQRVVIRMGRTRILPACTSGFAQRQSLLFPELVDVLEQDDAVLHHEATSKITPIKEETFNAVPCQQQHAEDSEKQRERRRRHDNQGGGEGRN